MKARSFLDAFIFSSCRVHRPVHDRRTCRGAVSRACLETLESRRLLSFSQSVDYYGPSDGNLVSADFNNDGRLDLAAPVSFVGNAGTVLLGKADGTFESSQHSGAAGDPPLVAGDLNGDGYTDLVTRSLSVLLGNGDGTFETPRTVALPAQTRPGHTGSSPLAQAPNSAVVGDVNADGKLDLIAGGGTSLVVGSDEYGYPMFDRHGYVNVLLGIGDGTFGQIYTYRVTSHVNVYDDPSDTTSVKGLGDFDGDGKSDVLVSAHVDGRLLVFVGNGDGTLQTAPRNTDVASRTLPETAADFDRDGKLDVLTRNNAGVSVMRGNGDGTFHPTAPLDFGAGISSLAVADINADGKLDIVGVQTRIVYFSDFGADTTRYARTLLGGGDGSFGSPGVAQLGTIRARSTVASAVLADFDGNGLPDLALSEYRISESGMASGAVAVAHNGAHIVNDELYASVSGGSVTEGNSGTKVLPFTFTLSSPSDVPVTVNYATSDGSATAASGDYQAGSSFVTFAPGETSRTVNVIVNGDRRGEADEYFNLNITGVTNAGIATGSATGLILDNEPRIRLNSVSITEGDAGTKLMTFTATLSAAYDQSVTVNYATQNGSATAGNDYTATSGVLTFAAGQVTRTFTVVIRGDKQREYEEYFYVRLTGASTNAWFDTEYPGVGTIMDNDRRIAAKRVAPFATSTSRREGSRPDLATAVVANQGSGGHDDVFGDLGDVG